MTNARSPGLTTSDGMVLTISPALQKELDLAAVHFLSGLFVASIRNSRIVDKGITNELGFRIGKTYPGRTRDEYIDLINQALKDAGIEAAYKTISS